MNILDIFNIHASKCIAAYAFTHTGTKQGTTLNPNQTAMSHTVTVATVASSMQTRFCHISGIFFFFFAPHRHNQVIPALISQPDQ